MTRTFNSRKVGMPKCRWCHKRDVDEFDGWFCWECLLFLSRIQPDDTPAQQPAKEGR